MQFITSTYIFKRLKYQNFQRQPSSERILLALKWTVDTQGNVSDYYALGTILGIRDATGNRSTTSLPSWSLYLRETKVMNLVILNTHNISKIKQRTGNGEWQDKWERFEVYEGSKPPRWPVGTIRPRPGDRGQVWARLLGLGSCVSHQEDFQFLLKTGWETTVL